VTDDDDTEAEGAAPEPPPEPPEPAPVARAASGYQRAMRHARLLSGGGGEP
jgi:hypothetical protein